MDDVIELGTGDQVVVDGEVLAADGLEVDESLLTGESDPLLKDRGSTGRYRATRVGGGLCGQARGRDEPLHPREFGAPDRH